MYIKTENTATRSLKLPWMAEPVEFTEDGTGRCSRELGERLVEEVDAIVDHPDKHESSQED